MEKQLKPNGHNNFLKNRFLRNIFIMAVILTLTLPISHVVFIHPAFTRLLIEDKVDDAISIAKHLSSYVPPQSANLGQNDLPVNFFNEAVEYQNDFGLRKLKVFSKSGEVIFSTDTKDVGTINRERYLHEVMEKAEPYTEVVTRHTKSLEGQKMSADVVETYVPLMKDDSVLGAFEIYYDITLRKDQLHNLLLRFSGTLTILAGGLLILILIVLFKEHRIIAQREQTEEELRESEERYRSLFTNNHAVMLLIDSDTADIVDANPAACSFYGYTREEITAKRITDINTLTNEQVHQEMQRAKSEERQHFFFRHRLAEGEIRDVEVYSGPIALRGKQLLYSIIHDISARKRAEQAVKRAHDGLEQRVEERTADLVEANERLRQEIKERKRIEEALRNSEKKYRALINEASDAIILSDTEGNVLDTNKKALELFGYSKDELLQKHIPELHPKEEVTKTLTAFKEAVQKGSGSLNDAKILRKDGETVPVDITGSVIQYGDQKVVQGLFRDITQRKLAENAIRQAEEQYRLLVQNLPSIVYKGYQDWSVDFFDDKKIESQLGYNLEDFNSRKLKWSDVIVEEDLEQSSREFVQAMRTDKSYMREYRIKTKAGDILWIEDRGQIVCDEAGEIEYLSGVFLDITDRKHTDEALRKSEKELRFLSAQLLNVQEKERARIARELHDGIGQALSTLKMRIETLAKIVRSDVSRIRVEDLENLVPMIRQTIEEVRNTSMDLRPSTLDSLGILPTIDWFCREFQTTYPAIGIQKQIDIQENEVPESLKIVVYRILQEALNNVAKHSNADLARVSLAKTDGKATLVVEDNGRGFNLEDLLSADTAKRGFGVTSMKERTELSGGSFSIESSVGEGTTIQATWKV